MPAEMEPRWRGDCRRDCRRGVRARGEAADPACLSAERRRSAAALTPADPGSISPPHLGSTSPGPIVAALVPKRSRDKTMLLGKDYAGELHSFVAPSSLPKKLGGELDNGNQWKK